ncbi:MAG TPA: glycosyltransferase family 4 protein [Bryobacteraceae bacterium]|nr:glycosyltransferase family 4 protein [Bryobacteraceae bacterium]
MKEKLKKGTDTIQEVPDRIPVMLMTRELGPGGTERQLTELALALDLSRFQVHVGCFHEGFRADELRLGGIPILRLPVTSFMNSSAVTGAWQLGRYLRRHKIRLVHTFDSNLNCFGVPVARACGIPVVLSSQRFHRHLTPPRFRKLIRMTDRIVSGIVVNSESVRREMVQEENVPASRVHLCHNGVDIRKFNPEPRLRMPVLQNASLVIGVVCLLRPEKGLQTLLRAFAQLWHLQEGVRLVFVGSGPEQSRLETLAQELGVREQCVFQPTVSAVAPWLRSIDIFVLPSLSEALSNSLMEAMACGCACIASSVGGNPELVRDNETGLLFEPANIQELAEKVSLLACNAELRERLARASLRTIQTGFSLTASAARMREIYDSYLT